MYTYIYIVTTIEIIKNIRTIENNLRDYGNIIMKK